VGITSNAGRGMGRVLRLENDGLKEALSWAGGMTFETKKEGLLRN
jgi:hypothetical protein